MLFVGSGFATHNIGSFFAAKDLSWVRQWDSWLVETITDPSIDPEQRRDRLIHVRRYHPDPFPLIFIFLTQETRKKKVGGCSLRKDSSPSRGTSDSSAHCCWNVCQCRIKGTNQCWEINLLFDFWRCFFQDVCI